MKMDSQKTKQMLSLARDLASEQTDAGLDKASEVLLYAIENGCEDPEVLVTAANYMLQSPRGIRKSIQEKGIQLADKAASIAPDCVSILEQVITCYELILDDFPEKLNDIIKLCYKILDLNPDHAECMIILANQRNRPGVSLSLADTIGMLEWAREVEPDNKYVAFTLARVYLEAGEFGQAKALFRQITSDWPDSEEARGARIELNSIRDSKTKRSKTRSRKYGRN